MNQSFISDESQDTETTIPMARRHRREEKNNPTGRFFAYYIATALAET